MSGRRKVGLAEGSAWVFNRMAEAYDARPDYPSALIDTLAALAGAAPATVLELGAGVGHVALPLAARGFDVTALEPAEAMLAKLQQRALQRGLSVRCLHAKAEAVPALGASFQLGVIADALHFLDAALTGQELSRVLAPGAALAIVQCEFAQTSFMRALRQIMEESAPRRPRAVLPAIQQVAALCGAPLEPPRVFEDHTPISPEVLERILGSISFIGPAMNAERTARFRERVRAIAHPPVWSRRFTLHAGRRVR